MEGRSLLLLALLAAARALPEWSDATLNTFVHCANQSGPWSDAALALLVAQGPRFVVQERATARWQAPVNASAEAKMRAAARQIKQAFAGIPDRIGIFALGRAEFGFKQQGDSPENAIQRRANLVTRGRQKRLFRAELGIILGHVSRYDTRHLSLIHI